MKKNFRDITKNKKSKCKVVVYAMKECSHCNLLIYLCEHYNIRNFKAVDVLAPANKKIVELLEDKLKTDKYPIILCKKSPNDFLYIVSQTDLGPKKTVRTFDTIEEALEILLQYYYEI